MRKSLPDFEEKIINLLPPKRIKFLMPFTVVLIALAFFCGYWLAEYRGQTITSTQANLIKSTIRLAVQKAEDNPSPNSYKKLYQRARKKFRIENLSCLPQSHFEEALLFIQEIN